MAKSRGFSIYLLKEGYDATNALQQDHVLDADVGARGLPENASLFVLDSAPRPPWWRAYFTIEKDLTQVTKGALIFMPVGGRCFALSFGHVAHNLLDSSYEYDFGLRVTLNSLDPRKLKSTDTLDPGAAKRQRTQLPVESDLTLFDFDRDSTILRSLTGKVRDEHKDLFRHATGASNLRISTDVEAGELPALCEELLALYASDAYKEEFPEIQNIVPVRDPAQIEALNGRVLAAFRARDPDLNLTVPEIINYSDNLYVTFGGAGRGLVYDDVYIGRYFEYLDEHGVELNGMGIEDLRRHVLVLTDEDGNSRDRYSVYKSFVFDTTLAGAEGETFHLCEGNWYKIENAYIARLSTYLDPLFADCDLPPYGHASEGEYNAAVAASDPAIVCLDTQNMSPAGQTAIEPCDLLTVRDGVATFYHVKVSTLSAQLSHLFNQGVNAVELMRLEPQAIDKLEALVRELMAGGDPDALVALVRGREYRVVFGIVTRKNPAGRSMNLPLFSRISLMRGMKALQLMDVSGSVIFIADQVVAAEGRKKKRKKKDAPETPEELQALAAE
ncbi:sporadically distributed protein, TIGR04141 family [Sinorhizobium medicae]|nr:sporadically distributed protein, TIGR04141 family [Sinorhizobium medicae]